MDKIQQLAEAFRKLETEHEIDAFDDACRITLTRQEYRQLMEAIYS